MQQVRQVPQIPQVVARNAHGGDTSWTHLPPPPKQNENDAVADTLDGSESSIDFHVTLDEGFSDLKSRMAPVISQVNELNSAEGPMEAAIEELTEQDASDDHQSEGAMPEFKIERSS